MNNETNRANDHEQALTEKTGKKILLTVIVIAVFLIAEAIGQIGYKLFNGTLF